MDNGSTSNSNKIDPSLVMEIERLKSAQQLNEEIEVIIRTKAKISATERAEIERNGGKIGSVIGDIFTARIPAQAISKIAGLKFILYIEKSKKQQIR